jgi:hypothetical protein
VILALLEAIASMEFSRLALLDFSVLPNRLIQ